MRRTAKVVALGVWFYSNELWCTCVCNFCK